MFGGYVNQAHTSNILSFLFVERKEWQIVVNIAGRIPEPRVAHSAVLYKENMYMFGGKNVEMNENYNDLWVLDIRRLIWSEVKLP